MAGTRVQWNGLTMVHKGERFDAYDEIPTENNHLQLDQITKYLTEQDHKVENFTT